MQYRITSHLGREKGKVSHVTVAGAGGGAGREMGTSVTRNVFWSLEGEEQGVTCDGLEMEMEAQVKWVSGVICISIY